VIDFQKYLNVPISYILKTFELKTSRFDKNEGQSIISIVSYNKGEGKTFLSANLASLLAKSGKKVLFIDAEDCRLVNKGIDIKDYSIKRLDKFINNDDIKKYYNSTKNENLFFTVPGGVNIDPSELFYSKSFNDFLQDSVKMFDIIVIDTPAIRKYSDAVIIASKSTGTLIVADSGKTSFKSIEQVKWQLENAGAVIIGIILNKADNRV
jgi:capsular exopolysaccharide synthesis family protein